jgi:hypothetical protein
MEGRKKGKEKKGEMGEKKEDTSKCSSLTNSCLKEIFLIDPD